MRGQRDSWMGAKRMISREWLRLKNVQRGRRDLARIERCQQILLDNDLASSAVYKAYLGFHLGESCGIQHAASLLRHGHMNCDEIGVAIQIVEVNLHLDANGLGASLCQKGIVRRNFHPKG